MGFIKKKSDTITFLAVLAVTIGIFQEYILQWKGKTALLGLVFFTAAAAVVLDMLCRKVTQEVGQQLAIACVLPLLFCMVSGVFNSHMIAAGSQSIYYLSAIFFCTCYLIVQYVVRRYIKKDFLAQLKGFLGRHKVMLCFLLAAAFLRLPYLFLLPRWDSGEYYYRLALGVQHFEYTGFAEFVENFALCGHPTLGFCMVYMLGEIIAPLRVIGVTAISLMLTVLALWCIYRIFLKILPGVTPAKAAVYTFIVSMAPLFFSTTMYFNPDYALAVFFIFVIYSYVYKKPILAGVFSLMCFQTKETGLVLVGGLVLGIFVQYFVEQKGKAAVKGIFTDLRLYVTLAVTVLQFFYSRFIGGFSSWSQNEAEAAGLRWDNYGDNCLGFNPAFLWVKLKQQFLLNFNWVAVLVIFGCIVLFVVNRKRKQATVQISCDICGIVGAFLAFLAFSCLYITASVARYNVIGDILLYLILFYCICLAGQYIPMPKAEGIGCTVLCVLLAGQCFVTIDPVTRLAFQKLDAGNRDIYYTGKISSIGEMYYGDYLIYNTQYTYIDRAYDRLLAAAGYEPEEMDIYLPVSNGSYIAGNIPFYWLSWDTSLKKRVFYENEDAVEMETYLLTEKLSDETVKICKDKAILVVNPYWLHVNEERTLAKLAPYYEIGERKMAETFQGSIVYYEMTLKYKM